MAKARTHEEAGIRKHVSEAVYQGDVLADKALQKCSPAAKGAWIWTWFQLSREGSYCETSTFAEWGRMWGCSAAAAKRIIEELEKTKPCNVTIRNGQVTLLSRRLRRKVKGRENARIRVQRHREKQACNADVTGEKCSPSFSSSFSSSGVNPPAPLAGSDATPAEGGGGCGSLCGLKTKGGENGHDNNGEFSWDEGGLMKFVLGKADRLWVPELRKRTKAMLRHPPDRMLAAILDARSGPKRPGSVDEAMREIFGRLKKDSPPGITDVNWENAKAALRGRT